VSWEIGNEGQWVCGYDWILGGARKRGVQWGKGRTVEIDGDIAIWIRREV